ncbi:sugar transferase [Lactobacillus ruminis]|uniref:sugar transferase n=1 Tax=Ligilactobacillus ruminis TaxID=1623 RepID=UPI001020820B|nr:sugar transferase [Ligilactobacillus ruminis]MBS7036856.1 sugar transferase [Ligilactobacillus ruminis]MSB44059.1 sugar transferase [Ligilactobacillus ruminis]MSB54222.1 sugar transferase [Ligilactobacillus ruminis]MSB56358.1 sugar transferase [Ligilactobacillus ruminis]MSB81416.1 sugar transferase [Ligilactobacillus ruminis]
MLREWNQLPEYMQTDAVRPYYDQLKKKEFSLFLKRIFDIVVSLVLIVLLSPLLLVLSILIVLDSKGGVFYRQERVTQYGRKFRIFKFRTMVADADKIGTQVTVSNDSRITRVGSVIRKYRLDEIPQLFNILLGDMSFVGTRPESTHYVKFYTPEMYATLLLPAGVTSEASIMYKDEADLLDKADDVDKVYIEKVLPGKMRYNLESISNFSFIKEIGTMFKTVLAVMR